LKILICIKQVPFVEQLKFDSTTKRVIREGVGNEINPFDRRAISAAVQLRDQFGGEAIVITMGPPQAKEALVEALAMGCDRAVHLLGREFAGADTLATARTLALACQIIGFDLILCGKYSTDAETAQVPPMLAEMLDLAQVTGVKHLEFSEGGRQFTATRELDEGFETVQSKTPAIITTAERLIKPIRVTPDDLEPARQKPVEVWGAADLAQDASSFGLSGSPTFVSEIFSIEPKRKLVVRTVDGEMEQVIRDTVQDLVGEGLFGTWKSAASHIIHPGKAGGSKKHAVWVVVELVEGQIRPVTLEILGRGIELAEFTGGELAAVLMGHEVTQHSKTLAAYGANTVYVADAPPLASYSTEGYTAVLANAIQTYNPSAVLIPSTANGRDLAPRVAARLNIGLTGDCIGLEYDEQQRLTQLKPAFGGNIIAPIISKTRPVMATIRPGILQKAEPDFSCHALIENLPNDHLGKFRAQSIRIERSVSEGIQLDEAEIVVGVGMGVGGMTNLPMVQDLAITLGAVIGASRRVVDAGWLPPQAQIGLTGRSIAPHLYVALGISGQFNHIVGVQRAGLVLAINKDPNAEIFNQSDYGIVGDLMVITPVFAQILRGVKNRAPGRP